MSNRSPWTMSYQYGWPTVTVPVAAGKITVPSPSDKALIPAIDSACEDCERCTWNPGDDCAKAEHPHCTRCGHCQYRHEDQHSEPERFVSADA